MVGVLTRYCETGLELNGSTQGNAACSWEQDVPANNGHYLPLEQKRDRIFDGSSGKVQRGSSRAYAYI